jgi:hypothetical protein
MSSAVSGNEFLGLARVTERRSKEHPPFVWRVSFARGITTADYAEPQLSCVTIWRHLGVNRAAIIGGIIRLLFEVVRMSG